MSDLLPPDIVAQMDQRMGALNLYLDSLIEVYLENCDEYGTAAMQGHIAASLSESLMNGKLPLGALIDTVVAAVVQLADKKPRKT